MATNNSQDSKKGASYLIENSPLDYSRQDLGSLKLKSLEGTIRKVEAERLLIELKGITPSVDNLRYEEFCEKLISTTFKNDFSSKTSFGKDKNREFDYGDGVGKSERDIHLPVVVNSKASNPQIEFWASIQKKPEDHIYGRNSRRIVFECKNNKGELTDKYIYQIFRYLDPGDPVRDNFGKFGVILCRTSKLSRNAKEALIRIKKDRYTIVIIDDDAIIKKWIPEYVKSGFVANFFEEYFNMFDTKFPEKLLKTESS